MLIVVAVILYLSYVVSRKVGGGIIQTKVSKNMQVLDQIVLGREKSLVIVRVGQKDYLLGVAQDNIRLLRELEEGQVEDVEIYPEMNPVGFASFLKDRLKNRKQGGSQ